MAVPVKFTPDMSDVKRAIAEVRSDASKGATFDISAGRSGLGSGGNSATPPANSILQSAEYSPVWRNWNNLPKGGNVNVDTANAFRQMGGLTGGGFPTPANPLAASNAHYASIAAGMQGWTTVGTTYPGGNVPAARPGPAANAPGAGGPSGGNWWNAVAALGTPAAPAGFWPGTGASGPPPAPPGQTPPGRSLWPGATSLGRYLGVGYITNEITRVADEGMTLSRETVLSGRGAMGGTDLMRQYKAQNRFNEAIAGLPVVGRVADLIVEAATGSKLDAESALQDAEQANERVDLSKRASTRRRLYSNDVTISAQRGGYAQAMARIAINGDEQYRAAKDEMNQMINAGDVAGGHKHFIEMSAWIQRDMEISRERATRGYRIELNLMGREAQRQKLLGEGRTDEAGLDAIHNEFDRRIAEEEDPNKKDAERTLGRATVLAYQKQVARRRQYAAEDTRDATIANQRMLDRDPLGARLSRVDHEERVAERDKERTDDQKRADADFFRSERDRVNQDDRDRKRYLHDELTGDIGGLRLAIGHQAMAGAAYTQAQSTINQANKLREQEGDPENANLLLKRGALSQQALRQQYFEGFERQSFDPTTTAIEGPRRGEDMSKYLSSIDASIKRLLSAQTAGVGAGGATSTD